MLEIYLIRHGESEANKVLEQSAAANRRLYGTNTLSELTERGIAQARELGRRFRAEGVNFDIMAASSTIRTQQTARYCMDEMFGEGEIEEMRAKLIITEDLRELSQGDWEGKLSAEARPPEVMAQLKSNPWEFKGQGAESPREVASRVYWWIRGNLLNRGYERAALFTHENAMKCFLCRIFNLDFDKTYAVKIPQTHALKVNYDKGQWETKNSLVESAKTLAG